MPRYKLNYRAHPLRGAFDCLAYKEISMFVSSNDLTLPVTVSSTPTAIAIPSIAGQNFRMRVYNDCGGTLLFKLETSSTVTLAAPVSGTAQNATAMEDGTVEMFNESTSPTHISVYSATGTGLAYFQFTYGDK